jgi:hypothetical protein
MIKSLFEHFIFTLGHNMRNLRFFCLLVLPLCVAALAQNTPAPPKRGPSTPEERKRLVSIEHKMETSPLDKGLDKDIKWALDWVRDVPDVTVNLCWAPLEPAIKSDYKYRAKLPGQFALSSAAFLIEHPDKAGDEVAPYIAGVEGVLRAYKSTLKSEPEATSDELDELLKLQVAGTLADYVRKAAKDCQQQPEKQS